MRIGLESAKLNPVCYLAQFVIIQMVKLLNVDMHGLRIKCCNNIFYLKNDINFGFVTRKNKIQIDWFLL